MNAMNNFTISGFVVNNAEVHNFEKSSIARFGISYRTSVKKDDQEIKLSAILNSRHGLRMMTPPPWICSRRVS